MARPNPQLLETERYPTHFELGTRFQDLDPNRHINNVATAALFEDARVRYDLAIGLREALMRHSLRPMAVSIGLEYIREMYYPAPVIAHVGALAVGRTSWTIGCLLCQDGRPSVVAQAVLVCTIDGRPVPLTDEIRQVFEQSRVKIDSTAA